MNVGSDIDSEYQSVFDLVKEARIQIFQKIQKALDQNIPIRGCDVDAFFPERCFLLSLEFTLTNMASAWNMMCTLHHKKNWLSTAQSRMKF